MTGLFQSISSFFNREIDFRLPAFRRKGIELCLYIRRWGQDLPCHLYGSFAFAILDETDGKLFCARDPFGIQTIYYHVADNGIFLYGSNLRTIVENSHYRKSLDREALHLYVLFGYPVGEKNLYKGIRKLMPGCSLIRDGESVQIHRWYSPSFHPDMSLSEEEWASRIDQVLPDILNEYQFGFDFRQCRSFLSGGVDSSYLLASSGVSEAIGIGFREVRFRAQIEKALFGPVSEKYFNQDILRNIWNSFLEGNDSVWRILYMVYIFVLWYENCYRKSPSKENFAPSYISGSPPFPR